MGLPASLAVLGFLVGVALMVWGLYAIMSNDASFAVPEAAEIPPKLALDAVVAGAVLVVTSVLASILFSS